MSFPGLDFTERLRSTEPNLLEGWIEERNLSRSKLTRLVSGYGGVVLFLAVLAVIMPAWLMSSTSRTALAKKQLIEISSQSDKDSRKDKELEALNIKSALLADSQKAVVHSINRLFAALNSKTDSLVIRKLRMEIVQDKLEVAGEAEAAHLTSANQFIQLMEEKGPGGQGILSSARQSGVIGANGISFQFIFTGKAKP